MEVARSPRYGLDGAPDRVRDRAGALGLTFAVYAVMLGILAIFGGSPLARIKAEEALNTILVTPPKQPAPPPLRQPPAHREGGSPKLHKLAPEPALVPATAAPAVIAPIVDLPKTEFAEEGPASAASGPSKTGGAGSGTGGTGTGTGTGSGPGGAVLYRAEFQKLNTTEELHRKVPKNAPAQGVGEIVCRTAKNFRVTDCKIWKETPKGSGFSEAVLGISNLFRVKPPTVDGKPMIGAWIVISIYYNDFKPPLYSDSH